MWRGNQHGRQGCDDFQNLLDITSHENPLFARDFLTPIKMLRYNLVYREGYVKHCQFCCRTSFWDHQSLVSLPLAENKIGGDLYLKFYGF